MLQPRHSRMMFLAHDQIFFFNHITEQSNTVYFVSSSTISNTLNNLEYLHMHSTTAMML